MWEENKNVRYRYLNHGHGIDDGFGNVIMQSNSAYQIGTQYLVYGEFF